MSYYTSDSGLDVYNSGTDGSIGGLDLGSISADGGTFWQGQDGNVYVAGKDGVNSANQWDDNTVDYWTSRGFMQTADPNVAITQQNYSPYNGSGGSGTSSSGTTEQDLQYLDQQRNRYQGLLDDSNIFQQKALEKLSNSFTDATNSANLQQGRALQDYNTKEYETDRGREQSLGKVNDNAYNLNRSLRSLLGMASGAGSSAFKFAAPGAVAKVAGSERGRVLSDYSDNMNRLKTARGRTNEDFENYLADLGRQKSTKEGELKTGYLQQQQSIYDILSQIASQRADLTGGNALAATAPFVSAYDDLQSKIVGLADSPSVATRDVNVAPVSLRDYIVDRQAINANNQFGTSGNSPYSQFLMRQRQEDERVA